ncbi:MAG TPA: WD40 repeat domain-containing protein [Gemmataceae bacterium]|nr:WD40 repeat domain-containing protein [Gemmataceae bacterium]
MSPRKRPQRSKLFTVGLLALAVVAVLLSYPHFRGSPPDGEGSRDRMLLGHTLTVQDLVFDVDGKTLTSAACHLGVLHSGVEVASWNIPTGNCVTQHHAYPGTLRAITLAPDGRQLIATVDDRDVVFWNVTPWSELTRLAVPALYGNTLTRLDDGTQLATTDYEHGLTVWDIRTGRTRFSRNMPYVSTLAISRGGTLLACATLDTKIGLWNPTTGEGLGCLQGHERLVSALAFSPDSRLLASGDFGGIVKLSDLTSLKPRASFMVSEDKIADEAAALVFSPDGGTLAVAVGPTVQLWDVATGQLVTRLERHQKKVNCLAFSPDGTLLASGSYDHTVRLWDVAQYRTRTP